MLAGLLPSALTLGAAGRDAAPRLVVLDWGLAATMIALGLPPVAIPAPAFYEETVGAPPLPAGVADIGLLFTPNFEAIAALRPDLLLIPPSLAATQPLLRHIAPVLMVDLTPPGPASYGAIRDTTRRLADHLGLAARGRDLVVRTETAIEAARRVLAARPPPVFVAEPLDDRHILLHGRDGLLGDLLARLGLTNAWPGEAETTAVGIEHLLHSPSAQLLLVGTDAETAALRQNPFWQSLPIQRQGRVHSLPPIWPAAGLPAAARFAKFAAAALTGAG